MASAISAGSPAVERERLRSVYLEQIRLYLTQELPQGLSDGSDACTVRIRQNTAGQILDVVVSECGDQAAWRHTLEADIRRTTPLPTPPRADVFEPELVVTIGKIVDVQP